MGAFTEQVFSFKKVKMEPDCASVNSSFTINYEASVKHRVSLPGFITFYDEI
jgi:hypothetical protein